MKHKDIEELKNKLSTTTWLVHNNVEVIGPTCEICGDDLPKHMLKYDQCFVCWRNRNPYVELK